MAVLTTVLTVIFVILCVLLTILILLQSDKDAGMGGLLGGSSQSAFGSSTVDVVTKITAVMVVIFMLGSLGLVALKTPKGVSLEQKSSVKATTNLPATALDEKKVENNK